jgi:DTW domain-containing protein YfiP
MAFFPRDLYDRQRRTSPAPVSPGTINPPFSGRVATALRVVRGVCCHKKIACVTLSSRSRRQPFFCLIMFGAEPLKPSNTGRLIADILPDTQAFLLVAYRG